MRRGSQQNKGIKYKIRDWCNDNGYVGGRK